MADAYKKLGLQCPCARPHCPGRNSTQIRPSEADVDKIRTNPFHQVRMCTLYPNYPTDSQGSSRKAPQLHPMLLDHGVSAAQTITLGLLGKRDSDLEDVRRKDHVERVQKGWGKELIHEKLAEERFEDRVARARAAEYLDTTAEQYASIANDLLVLRLQRQGRLAEQLRLMGALPDVPFDAQIVRGMMREEGDHLGSREEGRIRGLSWTRRQDNVGEVATDDRVGSGGESGRTKQGQDTNSLGVNQNVSCDQEGIEDSSPNRDDDIDDPDVVGRRSSQEILARTVNSIAAKVAAESVCDDTMPDAPPSTSPVPAVHEISDEWSMYGSLA